jgi:hypothetical protein
VILRRFVENLKQQHWSGVLIELVIVVLGVFIGLQVDNWNDDRRDRETEVGYLADLQQDVDYSTRSLEHQIGKMTEQQGDRKALYDFATDPDRTLEPAERDRLLNSGLFMIFSLNISEVTFETMKSSGRLALVHSRPLVSELQALQAAIEKARRAEADEGQLTYLFSDPILVDNVDMAGVFRQSGGKQSLWLGDAPDVAPTPAVMKTQRFANVVLYKAKVTELRLGGLQKLLESYRHIAVLISRRQAELRVKP